MQQVDHALEPRLAQAIRLVVCSNTFWILEHAVSSEPIEKVPTRI